MPHDFSRRDLLKLAAATAAGPAALQLLPAGAQAQHTPPPEAAKLSAYQVGPHIWIRWANQPLTSYRAYRSQKYPYMYPVAGPVTGLSLTTETSLPWPHHRSLLFACDRVNGGNYWQGDNDSGQILSTGPKLGATTPESAEILDACEWKKPDGPVICKDSRKITVTVVDERIRLIDWQIEWTAVEDLSVVKTNHSLCALRASPDITPFGGGTLVNAEGLEGEKATFGKPSAWCAYFGKRGQLAGETTEGIALFDHPKNPWWPCPWFTRDYGFISPSPMNFLEKPWTLPAGKSLSLKYRVVLFAGDVKQADLAGRHKAWTG